MVGREEEIPNVGDHLVYNVAGLSFLIVRHAEDGIKAFYNVCRHRGRQLVDRSGAGAPHFRCAYHAWAFDLEGKLAFYPGAWVFPDVTAKQYGLREVQFDRWGGFMFINPDLDAAPLAEHLGGLTKHFETWPLHKRFSLYHVRKRIRANWKVSIEAFLEAYHLMQTHPQALPSVAEHATQYDIWDEPGAQYSRSTTPCAVPSFHSKGGTPLGAIADMWALVNGLRRDAVDSLPEGSTIALRWQSGGARHSAR